MRIAYVCADYGVPVFGRKGSSIHVQEIARALQGHGAQVEMFATRIDGEPPSGLETVRLHRLPSVPNMDRAASEQVALEANHALREALGRVGPFDLVYERYSLWSFAGMEYAQASGTPGLLEVNAPLVEEQEEYRKLVDRANAERVAERVFGSATALIAVSEDVAAYLERFPIAHRRVHVVPNGVNPDRFPASVKPSCPARAGTFTVGFVGYLKPWHGLPILVEAFEMLHGHDPNTRLLIVGDGKERTALLADVAARGLNEAVHLTGTIDPDDMPGLLASMDVAVAPYPNLRHFYFSPLKVYEYMAAARPVVASRIGQLAELIQDGVNGVLCNPGDPAALAEALDRLRRDPELRVRLGQEARACVLREHTWDLVVRRILGFAGIESVHQPLSVEARG